MWKISPKQRPCHCSFQFLAENMKISTFTHIIGESIFFLVFYLHPFILFFIGITLLWWLGHKLCLIWGPWKHGGSVYKDLIKVETPGMGENANESSENFFPWRRICYNDNNHSPLFQKSFSLCWVSLILLFQFILLLSCNKSRCWIFHLLLRSLYLERNWEIICIVVLHLLIRRQPQTGKELPNGACPAHCRTRMCPQTRSQVFWLEFQGLFSSAVSFHQRQKFFKNEEKWSSGVPMVFCFTWLLVQNA